MKTEVVMIRELFGNEISQKSQSEMLSCTDLIRGGNKWRAINGIGLFNVDSYWASASTKEFISELESQFGCVKVAGRGRGKHTWVHPLLFIDIALSISPKIKVEAYKWMFDHLLMYRNESGDSYKRMTGALYEECTNKSLFQKVIVKVAKTIQNSCGVCDWNKATEDQLKMRDCIQNNVATLVDVVKDVDKAVELSIIKAIKTLSIDIK